MHTETYASPAMKPAGSIIDLTAAAHIDRNSPEPGTTGGGGEIHFRSPEPTTTVPPAPMRLRSPEPMSTKMTNVDFTYVRPSLKAAGRVTDMTSATHIDKRSPEPGTTLGNQGA
jgi:hypothetical protein